MCIDEKDFCTPRTPRELQDYVQSIERSVAQNPDLLQIANTRQGAYGRFFTELRPFSHYCRGKFALEYEPKCYLTDEEAGDAYIENPETGSKHLVEITWPIDGKAISDDNKLALERGYGEVTVFDTSDVSLHEMAVKRVLDIAKNKSLKDYGNPGGSTLLFVFDKSEIFWDDIEAHVALVNELVLELAKIEYRVDNVELLLFGGNTAEILPVKSQNS